MLAQRDRENVGGGADGATVRKSNYYVGGDAVAPVMQQRFNIDAIQRVVKQMSKQQLIDILVEMKKFLSNNPEGGKQMLIDNPVLAQALLQIQLLFGLVKSDDMMHIQPAMAPPMPAGMRIPGQPPGVPMQPPPPQPGMPMPPQAAAQPTGLDALLAKLPPAEQNVLREVLKLSPEQIRMLPAHVQQQVQLITSQLQKR